MSPNSTAYKREVFEKAGMFDESYLYCQDVEFSYRVTGCGYKLLLLKDVGSKHYWRETFKGYTKQQYNVAYGRMQLVKDNPSNVKGDKVSGLRMTMQIPATGLIILLYLISIFYSQLLIVPSVLLGLLLVERLEEAVYLCWKKKSISILLMPVIHIWRNTIWGIAGIMYMLKSIVER